MGSESNEGDGTPLSPDEAFAAIGHETRVRILEALAETDRAERPLSFSALRERVGTTDSSNFNYHLDTLVGHFVARVDDGYTLRRAGKRVAEAILSGAVTGDPVVERTQVEQSCQYCGAPIEVSYRQERLAAYCPECPGAYGGRGGPEVPVDEIPVEHGFLGLVRLPSAGVVDRTPTEVYRAATSWSLSEELLTTDGTCPRCSATLEEWVDICEEHQAGGSDDCRADGSNEHQADGSSDHRAGDVCGACGNRYAAQHSAACTNCVFARRTTFGASLLSNTELQAFLTIHGINLASPAPDEYNSVMLDYEETILGTQPFEARFTFTAGGDAITLTVDDEFDVVDVSEHDAR